MICSINPDKGSTGQTTESLIIKKMLFYEGLYYPIIAITGIEFDIFQYRFLSPKFLIEYSIKTEYNIYYDDKSGDFFVDRNGYLNFLKKEFHD